MVILPVYTFIWYILLLWELFSMVQFLSNISSFIDYIQMRVTWFTNDTKEVEWVLPALSLREVDLMPPLFVSSVLHDKISLWGTASFLHPCKISIDLAESLLYCYYFCVAEETSQFRSYQSLTWDSACWECFWGFSSRSPRMDPTLCLEPPGDTKVSLKNI